jgi:hypothetical protein
LHLVALVDALERAELPAVGGPDDTRDEAAILERVELDTVERQAIEDGLISKA